MFILFSDHLKCYSHSSVESVRLSETSSLVRRLFHAAVLLLGIYITRIKRSPNRFRAAHGNNATMVIFFTMTFHCYPPTHNRQQPSEWSQVAVEISLAICLSCALGRAVHILLACRTAHTVIASLCPTQQKLRALPVTVLLLWFTFNLSFQKKNVKLEDVFTDTNAGSTLKSWVVLGQLELLATLYCMFVSLPSLLQSILTKLYLLSVFLHVQLVTCLQNSRMPIKYVLVIKINRVI